MNSTSSFLEVLLKGMEQGTYQSSLLMAIAREESIGLTIEGLGPESLTDFLSVERNETNNPVPVEVKALVSKEKSCW